MTLSELIRDARSRAGLTRDELAASSGLDAAELASIESGQRNPSSVELADIADGLGITMAKLVGMMSYEDAAAELDARVRAAADVDDETAWRIGLDVEGYPRPTQ